MKSLKPSEAQARMRAESNHDGNRMALVPRNFSILPSVAHARLPATYDAAKLAISRCARVDECKDWADKMAALGSYAKQSHDESLRKMAERIQARAIERCGELLKELAPENRGGRPSKKPGRAPPWFPETAPRKLPDYRDISKRLRSVLRTFPRRNSKQPSNRMIRRLLQNWPNAGKRKRNPFSIICAAWTRQISKWRHTFRASSDHSANCWRKPIMLSRSADLTMTRNRECWITQKTLSPG